MRDDKPPQSQKNIPPQRRIRAGIDLRSTFFKLTGVDLFSIPGLGADTLLTILAEVGFDMTRWKTEKHLASWLALCSGTIHETSETHEMDALIRVTSCNFVDRFTASIAAHYFFQIQNLLDL